MEFTKGVLSISRVLICALSLIFLHFTAESYASNEKERAENPTEQVREIIVLGEDHSNELTAGASNHQQLTTDALDKKKVEQNQKVLDALYKNIRALDSGVLNYEKKIN